MVKCKSCFWIDSVNHLLRRVKCQNKSSERTVRKNDESYLKLPSKRNFSWLHACTLLGEQQGTTNE